MEGVRDIESSAGVLDIAVATTAVIYTKSFRLDYGEYFALFYKATSDGNVKLKIELQQSTVPPDTEGAADAKYVTKDGDTAIEAALATETQHIKAITPISMKYARLKITGLGGESANDASTTIRLRIGQRDLAE